MNKKMKQNKLKQLNTQQLSYLAGFLEGDGCILAQIVKGNQYKYKYIIRISVVFYQKKDKHWFFLKLKDIIGIGNIRFRKDGMMEYTISGLSLIKKFLEMLIPYLILKKNLAVLVLQIVKELNDVQNEADFIEVCKLVDKVAEHTYSKKRKNTSLMVQSNLVLPVETEKQ
jgi:hypothetical protein